MKKGSPAGFPRTGQGAALVLVLCFIVLLTALTVAYFSRAMVSRQLSNASTSAAQASTVASSAVDVIVGDFKQEIANGGTMTLAGNNPTYTLSQAQYGNAVPQRNVAPAVTATGGVIPNLVRRSARGDAVAGNTTDYVPAPAMTSRASAIGSNVASVNGRFVSPARWNRHLLIPTVPPSSTGGPTISTTSTTPVSDFTVPDWVFVTTEKGPSALSAPTKDAGGNPVTVTGRYAYAIYDEGGLLDINHTGYPSTSTTAHIGAKPAPSYADLTQLPWRDGTVGKLTAANVDKLLAWRQYATLQASGAFPNNLQPSTSQTAEAAYYGIFNSNPRSLLQVPLAVWNGKTDQAFLSRQQLINFFNAASLDPWYLQFLGTFDRGLNQPSYAPEVNRQPVSSKAGGGNDSFTNASINPNFLTVVVQTAFNRPDGVTPTRSALVGEPLVKQRFSLNRLAWLTYKGPSAERNFSEADVASLINDYGITTDFLKQGTRANIEYYFGLDWGGSTQAGWNYVHGGNVSILNISNSGKPTDVVRSNREPDFFELLKASINPGSLAKASIVPDVIGNDQSIAHAAQNQYKVDSSLDSAILQIGANIIDQFDTDSFPTRINYTLGSIDGPGFVYGVENLPYISRIRAGLIRLVDADPPVSDASSTKPINNTGVAALMNYPELWNPHDWSSTNPKQSSGAVYPRQFKVYVVTNSNNGIQQSTTVYTWNTASSRSNSCDADLTNSPGFQSVYGLPFGTPGSGKGGDTRYLTEGNTKMTFTVDPSNGGGTLFREPTILFQRGYPTNSNLDSPTLVNSNPNLGVFATPKTNKFFAGSGGGLLSTVQTSRTDLIGPKLNTPYVGFYIGSHPLRWAIKKVDAQGNVTYDTSYAYQSWYGSVNDSTYILACEDGNNGWITYDMKSLTSNGGPDAALQSSADAGFGLAGIVSDAAVQSLDYGARYQETVDPRSSRFGMLDAYVNNNFSSIPPRGVSSASTFPAEQAQGIIKSTRDGIHSGTALWFIPSTDKEEWFASAMGWYHDGSAVVNMVLDNALRPGLLSQNNPAVIPDGIVSTGLLPNNTNVNGSFPPFYYSDADGVVRRASGGNVPGASNSSGPAATATGLPMVYATATYSPAYSSGTRERQLDSRPVVLNRPFRSVAELGYVYSGTPWKNLDFFLPESGDSALLDVFCVNDNSDDHALTAGQVNLNTHQVPVLQAILAQTDKDLWNDATTAQIPDHAIIQGAPSFTQAQQVAQLLFTRTAMGPTSGPYANKTTPPPPQPLQNISDLIGRWVKPVNLTGMSGSNAASAFAGINGVASYDGFTADLANAPGIIPSPDPTHNIQRFGEGAIRALANVGQTRVWNLMFDIVAQTGRYTPQATATNSFNLQPGQHDYFNVEGEQHYWVHIAIDRCTGQVVDKQVEIVTE